MATGDMRVEYKNSAIQNLLKSSEVQKALEKVSNKIANAAGAGFESYGFVGSDRAHGGVHADTYEARVAEAKDRALSKAIDAGRG
jgi:hypothetical protein